MARILITGGCGFVGRHLVARLAREGGHELWIIDDLSTGKPPAQWEVPRLRPLGEEGGVQRHELVGLDQQVRLIRADFVAVAQAELGMTPSLGLAPLPRFDEIYHLASVVGGRNVIDNDPLAVGIDLAVDSSFFLWAAKKARPERILYASSSAAYPIDLQEEGESRALREDDISFDKRLGLPDYTYGWSKLTGEYLGRIAHEKYGLSVGVVRPFSGYGEDQDVVYPFPAIALRVAARRDPVRVWGSGEQTRDFVHIDDACDACVLVCRGVSNARAFNIGTGTPTRFLDLAGRMVAIEGYDASVIGTAGKPVGVAERYSDSSRIRDELGWRPRIALDDGIRRALDYARVRLERGIEPDM
ncbi:NAD-dependent epimerase/dehydratase family protein [Sphingomonas citri]